MPIKYSDLSLEARERKKAYGREYYHKRKTDPDFIQIRRDWYKHKIETDPGFYLGKYSKNPERNREYARMVRRRTRKPRGTPGSIRYEAKLAGFKSGFERSINANLLMRGVSFTYETLKVPYILTGEYNPDFILDNGIIVEAKGLLDRESKRKMVAVKKQHPELDIRFLFMNASKTVPGSKQSHAEWASKNGFPWAEHEVPEEWTTPQ